MTFGEKLQTLRAREGLSQDALAELLNVSRQAVSRWERDETMPETEKVVRISDHFHVTTDYLLKDGPEQFPPASRPLPDPAELWNQYGFVLGWLLAAWGAWWALRMLPMAFITMVNGFPFPAVLYLLPGGSLAAAGVLLACRWQKAARLRRQDAGWALALWGGLMLLPPLLLKLIPQADDAIYSGYETKLYMGGAALGLLLALLPPSKRQRPK